MNVFYIRKLSSPTMNHVTVCSYNYHRISLGEISHLLPPEFSARLVFHSRRKGLWRDISLSIEGPLRLCFNNPQERVTVGFHQVETILASAIVPLYSVLFLCPKRIRVRASLTFNSTNDDGVGECCIELDAEKRERERARREGFLSSIEGVPSH